MKTILIGAGNLATHLGHALQKAGVPIVQVYSRTPESASALSTRLQCAYTTKVDEISAEAELYVFAVRDAVLEEVAQKVKAHLTQSSTDTSFATGANALFVHTAGSMSMNALPFERRGAFYPMQTFSKEREVDFSEIPVFVESQTDAPLLLQLAQRLSKHSMMLDEEKRKYLHVAAVFACNFTNHMYDLCATLLESHGIPFEVMRPLIDETARKVHTLTPHEAQTGPAVRYDTNVMQRHLECISDPTMKQIYKLLSESIHDKL